MTKTFIKTILALAMAAHSHADILQQRFLEEQIRVERGAPVSDVDKQKVQGVDVLLVNGFMVDQVGQKPFEDFKNALDQDWALRRVESRQPSSSKSIEQNADILASELGARTRQNPLIIVGHSKGAAETLVAMLKRPQLLQRDIKVVLLQGALHGAQLAGLSDSLCLAQQALGLCDVLPYTGDGLESLKRRNQSKLVDRVRPRDEATLKLLKSKVFTIGSFAKNVDDLGSMFRASHFYLGREGRNDAVLNTVDEEWSELSTPLGVIEANHIEFTGGEGQNEVRTRALVALILKSLNR